MFLFRDGNYSIMLSWLKNFCLEKIGFFPFPPETAFSEVKYTNNMIKSSEFSSH